MCSMAIVCGLLERAMNECGGWEKCFARALGVLNNFYIFKKVNFNVTNFCIK